jgi:hypothetical protein
MKRIGTNLEESSTTDFETGSAPGVARRCPRGFAFYVVDPTSSIHRFLRTLILTTKTTPDYTDDTDWLGRSDQRGVGS